MACEHLAKEPDTLVYTAEKCRPVGSLVKLISNWFKTYIPNQCRWLSTWTDAV